MREVTYNGKPIIIYEYADAYKKLAELAGLYRWDVTAVSRGGKSRKKLYYYNYPCSFDIETTTIRSGQMGYYHEAGRPLGFAYLYQWNIYDTVFMVRTWEQAAQMFAWIEELFLSIKARRMVFFDHNLSYEWGFCAGMWDMVYHECFAIDEHHPLTIVTKKGIMLRDSYKMSNMGLDNLCKDWCSIFFKQPDIMDYTKIRTPYTQIDHDTLLYSALDVLSLSEGIYNYLEGRGEKIWTKCPTSTSFNRAGLKKAVGIGAKKLTKEQKRYFKHLKNCIIDQPIYNMLLRQGRGGNTHTNRRYTGQLLSDVAHFDVVSMYPAMMICYPEYPIGHWMQLDPDCPIDTIKDFEANGYCTLFDVVLINPRVKDRVAVPYIPSAKAKTLKGKSKYSDNGRYLSGAAMLKTTLYGIEWQIIESQYDFDDIVILDGYFAEKGYLPDIVREYVLELYKRKTVYKNVPEKIIEYTLSKIDCNSVFGMSYTKPVHDKYEFTDQGIEFKGCPDVSEALKKHQNSTNYFLLYSTGSMVSTLGRVYMQRMLDAVGFDNFVYCDTDSIFALNPDASRAAIRALEGEIVDYQRRCGLPLVYNDTKGRPHELGAIDEEPLCEKFLSYGAKKYCTVEGGQLHSTIAGVPKKAGARIIGDITNFRLGMVFKGVDTQKMCLWYNNDEDRELADPDTGEIFTVKSNIAMLPVDYELGLSADYSECLSVEGTSLRQYYKDNHTNMMEGYI